MNRSFNDSIGSFSPGGSMDNLKRRSSSRSIKRKKFDDELVECSLPAKISKAKSHYGTLGAHEPVFVSSPRPPTPSSSNISIDSPPITPDAGKTKKSTIKSLPPPAPLAFSGGTSLSSKRNQSRKMKPLTQGHKDLGRWKPSDDLALINGILQTNDIKAVHRGLKFSCKFTFNECLQRWYTLLYDPNLSRLAVQSMKNLHPEVVQSIQAKALFTKDEEELLGTIKSNSNPTLDVFSDLLKKNPLIFHRGRTAKILLTHWSLLKSYHLLPDQIVPPLTRMEKSLRNFSEFEDSIAQSELLDIKDPLSEFEITQEHRLEKKEIRKLDEEMKNWAVIVQQIAGAPSLDTDKHTYAILKGHCVRYLMKFKDITIGRSTKDHAVDIDLSLEGPAWKASRRQATIRMRNNGDFFIANEGKRPIYVEGRPIIAGSKYKLNHNSIIEIAGLHFTFLINPNVVQPSRSDTKSSTVTSGPSTSSAH